MTHVICRLTAKNRDQLRNPTLGNRIWTTFTFFTDCERSPVLALERILKKLHVTNPYTRNAFTTYRPTDMFDSEITEFTDSQATSRLQDDIGDVQGALVYGQLADESTRRQHSQVADNYVDL